MNKLQAAGHRVRELEMKCELLRGLRSEFSTKAEIIKLAGMNYNFAISKSTIRENITGERASAQNQVLSTRSRNISKPNMHRFIECYYCMKKGHISAELFFNPWSKSLKGEKQHTPNGKKTIPCSEKDIAMMLQTCAFVSNKGLPSSEKWIFDSACTSDICNQRRYSKELPRNAVKLL